MSKKFGEIISINVGQPTEFHYKGRKAKSAIWKNPVDGKVFARDINLEGDTQAEDLTWWGNEIGRNVEPGELGENLTLKGVLVNDALIGERWRVGGAILEVSEPRIPCWRLGVKMNDKTFPRKFTKALRPGAYLRIIQEGTLERGDSIEILEKPDHALSVRDVFEIYTQLHANANKILEVSKMSDAWKKWANETLQKANSTPSS